MHSSRLFVLLVLLSCSSCQLSRFIVYNFADIRDHKKFPSRPLTASETPFRFVEQNNEAHINLDFASANGFASFEEYLEKNKTVAFLVIQRDSILYERYFRSYDQEKIVPSFSMAKSICSMLIGCAIDEGLIESVEDPIIKYLPELEQLKQVKIKHLLQMTSGIEFKESYVNPFGHAASFYYGRNLRKQVTKLQPKNLPGTDFAYSSGDTQVLGYLLDRVLGEKTITDYLQEKIWEPLQMEYSASWSIDRRKDGLEKTFCCLNARARDFAKLGRLYLHQGNWNGQQLISKDWVAASTKDDRTEGSTRYYQYQWWRNRETDYYAQGILGQFIYVEPTKDVIIVRLGKKYGKTHWPSCFRKIAQELN